MIKNLFELESSPTDWALNHAVHFSKENRHFSATCMVVVAAASSIPSATKNLTCVVVKVSVAIFAYSNIGQIAAIKTRTWSTFQDFHLISTSKEETLKELVLHVYKCVMFLTFSPFCCLTRGYLFSKSLQKYA